MTKAEADEMIQGMQEFSKEMLKSKDAIWKFLISAGIETEESRRKHEAKERKKESKK